MVSIDGTSGKVFLGEVPVQASPVVQYFEGTLSADSDALVAAVHRLVSHADEVRRLGVRANSDNPEDSERARRFGAQGIGLCRTEHMFLGDRRQLVEDLILADTDDERQAALDALEPLQKEDFVGIFTAMDGLPVTVRLIDPPLHEFLPDLTELSVKVAVAESKGEDVGRDKLLLEAVQRLHEANPMLGLRGVRLGLVIPGLFGMQVKAIAEAAAERKKAGGDPKPEIMIPLVGAVQELEIIKDETEQVLAAVKDETGVEVDTLIGTMIEVPRAALTAGQIAEAAQFFSFGTNDLTQMGWGFSRDDVEAAFFSKYLDLGIFGVSPFESLDTEGVGRLVEIATKEGRADQAGPQGRRLRRARRRPRLGALLPQGRARLRLLLAVPHPGRPAGGRSRRDRDHRLRLPLTCVTGVHRPGESLWPWTCRRGTVRCWSRGCGRRRCGRGWRSGRGSCCWPRTACRSKDIVERVGVSKPTVIGWKKRYAAEGLGGLEDRPKPGRPRTVDEVAVVSATLEPPPERLGVTHWSTRLLGAELGISHVCGRQDLAQVGPAAVADRDVQVLHRPRAGGQGPRRRRALPEPAGQGGRALRGREVPGPGAGPDRADPAAAARAAGETDPRLRPARHHHPVRRAGGRHRQGRAGLPATPAPPPGVPALPQAGRARPTRGASCTWWWTTTPPTSTRPCRPGWPATRGSPCTSPRPRAPG